MNTFTIQEDKLVLFVVACFLSVSTVFLCCPEYTAKVPLTTSSSTRPSKTSQPGSAPVQTSRPTPPGLIREDSSSRKVDPNFATYEELLKVPGIGPTTARAILSHRETRILFSASDLKRIKGIGPSKIEKMKGHFIFSGSTENQTE